MNKIGIIGSGTVGRALAKGFLATGHAVQIASRSAAKRAAIEQEIKGVEAGEPSLVAAWADIIVFAVKGTMAREALPELGLQNLNHKTIIDTTNPIADGAPLNGVFPYFTTYNSSLMETLQALAPEANFVKAFSCVGASLMYQPGFSEKPTMFICGNDENAKREVSHILDVFGWETEDLGKAEAARAIEPLCILWCIPGIMSGSWNHAFRLLKK